jgi:hypothetical protein
MELLLKRDERPGTFGTRYELFAKLELEPEELSRIRKTKPDKTVIVEDEYGRNSFKWRLMLIPAGIGAIILAFIVAYVIHPFLFLPVMLFSWLPLRKLLFNQMTGNVTVADIVTGRTIHCKSLDELLVKENEIKEKITNYCQNLESWHAAGDVQRINLNKA